MVNTFKASSLTPQFAHTLITEQFPECAHFPIFEVEKQGHDNRTYRLGDKMLIRMPTAREYALKVEKEQDLLPKLSSYLSFCIPIPIKMGIASKEYPYPFSIYKWLDGKSINLLSLAKETTEQLAFDLASFLKELQSITNIDGLAPGQDTWLRARAWTLWKATYELCKLQNKDGTEGLYHRKIINEVITKL